MVVAVLDRQGLLAGFFSRGDWFPVVGGDLADQGFAFTAAGACCRIQADISVRRPGPSVPREPGRDEWEDEDHT
jgi:hypothetical protein